ADVGVRGMTCAACVRRVERALTRKPGVLSAEVNLATGRASVAYEPGTIDEAQIRAAIADAGYEPVDIPARSSSTTHDHEATGALGRDLVLAIALTTPLVLVAMGPMLVPGLGDAMTALLPKAVWRWLEF